MRKLILLLILCITASWGFAQKIPFAATASTLPNTLPEWLAPDPADPWMEEAIQQRVHEKIQQATIRQLCTPDKGWDAAIKLRPRFEAKLWHAEVYCIKNNPDMAFVITSLMPNEYDMEEIEMLRVDLQGSVSLRLNFAKTDSPSFRFGGSWNSKKPTELAQTLATFREYLYKTLKYDYRIPPERVTVFNIHRPCKITFF